LTKPFCVHVLFDYPCYLDHESESNTQIKNEIKIFHMEKSVMLVTSNYIFRDSHTMYELQLLVANAENLQIK